VQTHDTWKSEDYTQKTNTHVKLQTAPQNNRHAQDQLHMLHVSGQHTPANQLHNQPTAQPTTDQPTNQPTNQLTQRPASQPASQPANQPTPINQQPSICWLELYVHVACKLSAPVLIHLPPSASHCLEIARVLHAIRAHHHKLNRSRPPHVVNGSGTHVSCDRVFCMQHYQLNPNHWYLCCQL